MPGYGRATDLGAQTRKPTHFLRVDPYRPFESEKSDN
jgi:hypothetical protein